MDKHESKAFIKLGTSVRYLKDVKHKVADQTIDDEPLGDKNVIPNVKKVLKLTKELGFVGTAETGSFSRLEKLLAELNEASKSVTCITPDQAERLSDIAENIRESLFSEGKKKAIYYLSEEELSRIEANGWPEKITLEVIKKTPFNIWKWFIGTLLAAIALGITISETGVYSKISAWIPSSEEQPQEVLEAEPGTDEKADEMKSEKDQIGA